MRADLEVPAENLRGKVDEAAFHFETTAELDGPEEPAQRAMVFQRRAQAALELGMAGRGEGFHIFAAGPPGLGKAAAALASLRAEAARRVPADDWAYVFDFARPGRPRPLRLPAGQAVAFSREIDELVEAFKWEIPRLLKSEVFRRKHAELELEAAKRNRQVLAELRARIRPLGYRVVRRKSGFEAVPAPGGRPVAARRRKFEEHVNEVVELADETSRSLRELELAVGKRHRQLERELASGTLDRLLLPLREKYGPSRAVVEYLDALRDDVLGQLDLFKEEDEPPERPVLPAGLVVEASPFLRYRVNVLVDQAGATAAPVVFEVHPTFPNLFGRVERKVELGALTTDFTLLKAGALHRANGGFLVLDAKDVLLQIGSWEGLKRCLRSRRIFLEDLASMLGITPVEVLQPEPIPLGCRVVLVGELWLYQLLYRLDPDFREIFQVRADFDDSVPVSAESQEGYARVVAAICTQEGLLPLDRGAVARVLELAMRLAEDQQRFSALWDRIREWLIEADHWARRDGAGRFRIWGVSTADEALEILLGRAVGTRRADGRWEEGSLNALVAGRLEQMSRAVRHLPPRFAQPLRPREKPAAPGIPGEPPVPPVHAGESAEDDGPGVH